MRRLARLAFVAGVFLVACGSLYAAAERSGMLYSEAARHEADITWGLAYAGRAERGACVASGKFAWGYNHRRELWAVIDSFATDGPQGPRILDATINRLNWAGNICGDSLPSLHTHIQSGDSLPSECDLMALAQRPAVPFGIVQWGVGRATLYTLSVSRRDSMRADTTNYCER